MDTADIEEFQHPSNLTMCLEAIESSVSFSSFFQAEMDNFFNQDENLIKPEEGEVLVERKIKTEPPDDWSKLSPSDMCFSSSEVTNNKTLLYTGNTQIKTEAGRMPLSPNSSSTRIIKKAKKKRKKKFPEIDRDSHFQDDTDAMRLGYTLNVQSDVPCETEPGEVTPLELVAVSVKTECKRENQKFSADTVTLNPSQLYDGKGQVKVSKKNEEKIISKILKFKSGQPLENDRQLLLADYYCPMPVRELNSDTRKNASQENGVQNHEQGFHDLKVKTQRDIDIPVMKKKRKKRKFTNCNANINSPVSDEALKRKCLRPCYVDLSKKTNLSDNDLNSTLSNEVKINKKKIKKSSNITENNRLYSVILENDIENNDKQSADQDTDLEVSENVEESRDSDTFNAESSIADGHTENDSKKPKQVSTETDPRQNHNSNENSKNDRKKIYKHKISRFELESLCKDSGLNVSEIESDNVCEINNGIRRRSARRRSQKVSNLSESHNWFSGISESDSESDENLVEEGPDFEVSESDANAEASDSDSEIPANHSNRKWHSFYNKQNVPESGEKPTVSQNGNYNSSHLRSILLSKPARSKKPSKNAVWFKDHYQSLVAKNGSNLQASLLDLRRSSSLNKKSTPWSWFASACSSAQNKFTPMHSGVNLNIPASLSDVSPAGLHSNPAPTSESEIPVNETQRVFPDLFTRLHPGLAVGSIPYAAVSRPVSHSHDFQTASDSFTRLHPGLAVGSIPNAAVSRPVSHTDDFQTSSDSLTRLHPSCDVGSIPNAAVSRPVSHADDLQTASDSLTRLHPGLAVGSIPNAAVSRPVYPANELPTSPNSKAIVHPDPDLGPPVNQLESPAKELLISADSQTSLCTGTTIGSTRSSGKSQPVSPTNATQGSADSQTSLCTGTTASSTCSCVINHSEAPAYGTQGPSDSQTSLHPVRASSSVISQSEAPANGAQGSSDSQTSLSPVRASSSVISQSVSPAYGTQGPSDSQTSLHPVRASSSVISQSEAPANGIQLSPFVHPGLLDVSNSSSAISQPVPPDNEIQEMPSECSERFTTLNNTIFPNHVPAGPRSPCHLPLSKSTHKDPQDSTITSPRSNTANCVWPTGPVSPRGRQYPLKPLHCTKVSSAQTCLNQRQVSTTQTCLNQRQVPSAQTCLNQQQVSAAQTCLNQRQVSSAQTCLNQRQNSSTVNSVLPTKKAITWYPPNTIPPPTGPVSPRERQYPLKPLHCTKVPSAQTCLKKRQNSSTVNSVSPTKKAITWYPPNTIPPPTGPVSPRERQYPLKPLHCTKVPSAQTCLKKRQVSSAQTCLKKRQNSSAQTCLKKRQNSSTVNKRKKKILTRHPPKTTPPPLNAEDDKSVKNDLFKLATSCEENVLAHFTQTGSQQEQRKLKTLLEKVQLRNWNLIESETEPEEANPVLYQCEERYCKKIFACEIKFARHMRKHKRKYICEICGKYFQNFTKMMCHVGNHSKKFKCTICDTEWSTRYNLRAHMLSHTGEKPYTCDGCGKGFARIDNYRSHMKKLHPDLPRYSCAECKEKFETLDEEKQHKKKVHPVIKVTKVYPCPHCGRNFGLQRKLKGHVKLHEAGVFDRKYSCKICKRSFNLKTAYTNHMIRHRIGGMLTCEICKVTFGLTKLRRKFVLKDDNGSQDVCEQCYFEWLKEQDPKNFSEMYRQARC